MSATEYTENGFLLSWNNGYMTRWYDTEQEAHNYATQVIGLTEYSVTTYRAIGHTVYRVGSTYDVRDERPNNAD